MIHYQKLISNEYRNTKPIYPVRDLCTSRAYFRTFQQRQPGTFLSYVTRYYMHLLIFFFSSLSLNIYISSVFVQDNTTNRFYNVLLVQYILSITILNI